MRWSAAEIFCREHVAQLREHEAEFKEPASRPSGADMNYARLFREEVGITFPLLIDEERVAYRVAGLGVSNLFHMLRPENMAARRRARRSGYRQRKLAKNPFQIGGSFVFSPGNIGTFTHM